jgi:hypothetical protein
LLRRIFKVTEILSRDRVQPTLYHHSENGNRRYGIFFDANTGVFQMKMVVRSYIGISMAFDYTLRAFICTQLWCSHCFGGVSSD